MMYKTIYGLLLLFGLLQLPHVGIGQKPAPGGKRNIVLIVTDDQGIGDIGYLRNPFVKTPNLDRLAKGSVILSNFYVSPVCAPTRASLMTGRYSIRTGVHDTYNGGALMATEERTIAEYFHDMGFGTAIFGKWHLGDNYPFRPSDQGFATSLVFRSGGIGQIGDVENYFKKDSCYFNPVLFYNDSLYQSSGYCSDVYTDAAISYMTENKTRPFFLYLAFNAPHVPLQLPRRYYDMYADLGDRIRASGNTDFLNGNVGLENLEQTKRVYGMMSNIDDNVGRLVKAIGDLGIMDNTILIFMSDNGPQQSRFKGGYKGTKSSVYEAGVKVPAFVYAPTLFPAKTVDETLAHIDMLPTLLDIENSRVEPKNIDGRSFASLLKGGKDDGFRSRSLYLFWQRGFPEPYRNIAVRKGDFKLVGNTGAASGPDGFELYNLRSDPGEVNNIGPGNKNIVNELKTDFDNWYGEVIRSSHLKLEYQRIVIGSSKEPKTILNRNDARGVPDAGEKDSIYFYWDVRVEKSGYYRFGVHFLNPVHAKGKLYLRLSPYQRTENNQKDLSRELFTDSVYIEKGDYSLESWYQEAGGRNVFPFYVEVRHSGPTLAIAHHILTNANFVDPPDNRLTVTK